ncbi:MAG: HEAT repeat domain-containing protein [Nitrospira sp.]|nr:HEAT repeat domain-containing protein [Nitrospira sp.]MCS6262761.1 HEAT repeat domain-containing protein [Nitrospira sp.]
MAEEAPVKLIQIGPKGGTKKDGFNLVTERVVAVNPEAKQLEVELLAYDGKTVVLDVGDEALEDFLKIKPGDGATIRVVEEGGKRIAKSFRIRAKDPNAAKADAMLIDLKDSHWLNRKYAAEVLGELKDPRAVVPLVEALSDEVGDVRQRAYDSLIKIGGSAVSSLVPLLVSEEDDVRQSATEIIRKIGKPAVEPLATALAEADDRLKTRIMKVLDRMGYKPKAKEGAQAEPAKLLS